MRDSSSNITIGRAAAIIISRVRAKIPTATGDIYLFGSRANGTQKSNSDYDICIFLDDAPNMPISSKQPLIEHHLQETLGERFSVFVFVKVSGECKPTNCATQLITNF